MQTAFPHVLADLIFIYQHKLGSIRNIMTLVRKTRLRKDSGSSSLSFFLDKSCVSYKIFLIYVFNVISDHSLWVTSFYKKICYFTLYFHCLTQYVSIFYDR